MLNGNNLGYFEPEGKGCISIENRGGLRGTPLENLRLFWYRMATIYAIFSLKKKGVSKSKVKKGAGGYHYWNI